MEWFKFHTIWNDGIRELSDAEAGRFLKALIDFEELGETRTLTGAEKILYSIVCKQLKQDTERNAEISRKRAENGRIGGLSSSKQKEANGSNCKQNVAKQANTSNFSNKNKELRIQNKEKDIESLSANAQKPAKPKPEKHQHGSFKNVLLTDAELETLRERFPDADKRIESFSVKKAAKGYVYKSDYAAIIAWAGDDGKKQQQQAQAKKTYTAAEVAEMIDRGEL